MSKTANDIYDAVIDGLLIEGVDDVTRQGVIKQIDDVLYGGELNRPEHRLSFRVSSSITGSALESIVDLFDGETLLQRMSRDVVNIKEKQVRDSLVALGWTPPVVNNV